MSSDDFAELGISAPVLKVVQQLGYEQPSPVQAQSIPILLNGQNLLGTAQTGTGKTCLLYTSPSPRDGLLSRMPSSA